jgi:hypothetical protein
MSKFIKNQRDSSKQYAHNSHGNCCDVIILVALLSTVVFSLVYTPLPSKLGLTYLKIEARWVVSNIDTRSRVHMRVAAEGGWAGSARFRATTVMVVGEAVHTCGRWCSGVRWSELMVELDCGGWSQWLRWHACMCGSHIEHSCGRWCSVIRFDELYFLF